MEHFQIHRIYLTYPSDKEPGDNFGKGHVLSKSNLEGDLMNLQTMSVLERNSP